MFFRTGMFYSAYTVTGPRKRVPDLFLLIWYVLYLNCLWLDLLGRKTPLE